ncbi:MAG: DUF342 domain-containing protein [Chitinispirillaceae bacterium]|nr:DUF342 domain-containing protein [Chitinispirillaceae bacterium]
MFIGIREARPGMTLADDIELPGSAGLIEKSRVLSADTIELLIRSGISRIKIVDPGIGHGRRDDAVQEGKPASPEMPSPSPEKSTAPSAASSVEPLPPRLSVHISPDAMTARLVIDPAGPVSQELDNTALLLALENGGVVFGVNNEMIADIIQRWKATKRHYEFDRIAKGSQPEPGKEGAFHIKSLFLSNAADVEAVQTSQYYWQAIEKVGTLHRISAGTVVAEKHFDTPPIPGSNVRGDPLLTDQMISKPITLKDGVAFSPDKKQIVAQTDGILYFIADTIGLLCLNFNGSLDVVIEKDQMSALLAVHPPAEGGGGMPGEKEIMELLANNRVTWGIDKTAIADLVKGFDEGRYPAENVVVAKGQLAKDGENGKVDFLFTTTTSLKPKVNPDGTADYKNVNIVISVTKGQELARLTPPTRGTPGKNIFGEALPCKEGSPAVLPIGPNTEPHPSSDDILVASVDGLVRYSGSYVEVCEGYVIKGDVDFSTGNVKYEKSVIINGDIKAGFSVECGGDLQVSGIIEDCTLTVGGNVLCKHGFVGQGKGTIDAKGDVNLGFLMNQTVRSHKSVNVAKEAINSTIYARESVSIHGKPVSIAGGTVVARDLVSVYAAGNQSGVRTAIETGLDFTLAEELKKNELQVAEVSQKSRKVIEAIKRYRNVAAVKKKFSAQEEFLFNKLKLAMAKIEEQLRLLEERKKIIMVKMQELEQAAIKIEHAAFPGTLFKIGDRRFVVKEEIIGPKTVRLIRQEIHIL